MWSSNPYPRELPKTQTTSLLAARFQRFSPRWSAFWAPHYLEPRPRRRQSGGIAPCKGATRRRHAVRRLRMAQNPHYRPNRGHPMACWARTHRLRQPCVTNVVKLAHFETPFNSLCYKRRQSEPKNQYFQRKRRRIDDFCNKTQAGPPNRRPPRGLRGQAAVPVGGGGAWPGFEARRRTK